MQTIKLYRVTYTTGPFEDRYYVINRDFTALAKAERFAKKTKGSISEWDRPCAQDDLDFWLRSYVTRGTDHTPGWVTVPLLLKLGANPNARVPDFDWTCVQHCHEMLTVGFALGREDLPESLNLRMRALFQGYLNQFAKAGHAIVDSPAEAHTLAA